MNTKGYPMHFNFDWNSLRVSWGEKENVLEQRQKKKPVTKAGGRQAAT
jgi:hypothetical protein